MYNIYIDIDIDADIAIISSIKQSYLNLKKTFRYDIIFGLIKLIKFE